MHFIIERFYTMWELTGSRMNLTYATTIKVVMIAVICLIILSIIRWMGERSSQSDRL
ncbi:MAG: hypothetical protein ACAI35_24600 [Candidatus Methylacidiphilales bacterium]|nr:hypothetical protein [Candidatus Methylacidiphilales bacterium]